MEEYFVPTAETDRLIQQSIILFALVTARIIPIVQLAPFLGGSATPQVVKMGIAFALTIIVYPTMWSTGTVALVPSSGIEITVLILKELLIGVTLGFVTSLIFESVRIAGQIVDNARGQTMATAMVPFLPERVSVSADLLYQLAIVFFLLMGGHRIFLAVLVQSFVEVPPLAFPDFGDSTIELALLVARYSADSITFGVLLGFPVMASILLADLFLGLVNKAAPQINVFFLGMPLKASLGVFIVLAGLQLTIELFFDHSLMGLDLIDSLIKTMGGSE